MRMVEGGQDSRTAEPRTGLAAWLIEFFQTSLRERFSKLGQPRAARRMQVAEVLSLGGKRQLMLVLVDGQRYLVGTSGDGVETISALGPEPAEVAAPPLKSRVQAMMQLVPSPRFRDGERGC